MLDRRISLSVLLSAALAVLAFKMHGASAGDSPTSGPAAKPAIDFARDVQPIFAAHCYACHGADKQESGLRLDRKDDALKGGDGGAAIIAMKGGESPLVDRIASSDPDLQMPPKGERLTVEQIAVIRAWIDQGANWDEHWSLKPLARPEAPNATDGATVRNSIDAFVTAKLNSQGLKQSPEADRRTLIRRVTIDLTGLLPTPDEVAAFVASNKPDAYEQLVERLLSSPRYGERWARHWMDTVHFAETHGNDQDRPRPNAWPYRDYLIQSFNEDKPYARFVAEQIAGDVLYPKDPQATVALGFLSAGPWDESSLMSIADDTTDKKIAQMLDRDDMLSTTISTFVSATVHCARCHNHKFDPISQADYYSLQAVFAGVDRAERPFGPDAKSHVRRASLSRRQQEIDTATSEELLACAAEVAAIEQKFIASRNSMWQVLTPAAVSSANGSSAKQLEDGSLLYSGDRPEKDVYTLEFDLKVEGISALRLELLTDDTLPFNGPGRQDNGNLHLSEIKLAVLPADGGEAKPVEIASAQSDFDQAGWGVAAAIDGKPETAWGIYPEVGRSHLAAFVLREPIAQPTRLRVTLEQLHGRHHLIGRPRVAVTTVAQPAIAKAIPPAISTILDLPSSGRTAQQQSELARFLLKWNVESELAALPPPKVVYAATNRFKAEENFRPAEKPRSIHILNRGDIGQPREEASAGTLSCIEGLPARFALADPHNEGERRAALARWLIDPQNVLTWRSIVNRVWQYHFGRGIVDTPNDLGLMGGQPSHPELLDWLAVEFRDRGGSLKELHRLIVSSATYRQASQHLPEAAQLDAENRLLWRMNRTRLDAESIRDAVLQVSGKLDLTMGGPSVKQFVESPGIHITPNVDYRSFDADSPNNFRRSIYRFLFRTLPDPFMDSMGCPDGAQLTPKRDEAFTALQALSLLNNQFILRQSEYAAERIAKAAPDLRGRIKAFYQLALLRDPTEDESLRWEKYAAQHGLANVCRMIFNSNEFLFVP
jgi:mono/diheme cytochrome c family protein